MPPKFSVGDRVFHVNTISRRILSDVMTVAAIGNAEGIDEPVYQVRPTGRHIPDAPWIRESALTRATPTTRYHEIDPIQDPVIGSDPEFLPGFHVIAKAQKDHAHPAKYVIYGGPYLMDGNRYYDGYLLGHPEYPHLLTHTEEKIMDEPSKHAAQRALVKRLRNYESQVSRLPGLRKLTRKILSSRRKTVPGPKITLNTSTFAGAKTRTTAKMNKANLNTFRGSKATATGKSHVKKSTPPENVAHLIGKYLRNEGMAKRRASLLRKGKTLGHIEELQ